MTSVAEQPDERTATRCPTGAGRRPSPATAAGPRVGGPAAGPRTPSTKDILPAPPGAPSSPCCARCWTRTRAGSRLAAVLLLIQQAAVQAGPLLVAYAIDHGDPGAARATATAR